MMDAVRLVLQKAAAGGSTVLLAGHCGAHVVQWLPLGKSWGQSLPDTESLQTGWVAAGEQERLLVDMQVIQQ
jgi:hypothetical protein